jgi:endoglucanase
MANVERWSPSEEGPLSRKLISAVVLAVLAIVAIVAIVTIAFGATPKTGPHHAKTSRPVHTKLPSISGSPVVGHTLHASRGHWTGASKFVYQWKRCNTHGDNCKLIHRPKAKRRQSASAYTLTRTDLGHRIRVTVIASNRHGSGADTSPATAVVRRTAPAVGAPVGTAPGGAPASSGLHVVGNGLEDGNGQRVVLHGTDISGSAYACEQNGGYAFSDTPSGASLYAPMRAWHINSVTIGINQDCWLGINGVKAQYSGQNYVNWVKAQVTSMEQDGIYPVIGFFVGEPASDTPNWYSLGNGNAPMPDSDHVPLVWEEIANTFKSDPNVIFRLYEEPYPDSNTTSLAAWQCWSQGDVQYGTSSVHPPPTPPTPASSVQHCSPLNKDGTGTSYSSVGMQSLVNIIRGTGANNVIQIPGVAFANMLSCSPTQTPVTCGFLDSRDGVRVTDPASATAPQLMADTDNYPDTGQDCGTIACVNTSYAAVAGLMPIDMGEAGVENNSKPFPLIEQFIDAYDTLGQSYYLSQWETWTDLISNYNGAAHSGWGTWAYDHLTGG